MNNRLDHDEYLTSNLEGYLHKLSHNTEQKYKEMVAMSEKIRCMEDRSSKPNTKIIGVQKETKERFGNRIITYILEENYPGLKIDLYFHIKKGLVSVRQI